MVLCHPHPRHGGTKDVGLIPVLHRALAAAGFAVLRFDFRGAGASGGQFGHGVGEVLDVAAAIEHLRTTAPDVGLAVVGWSFGAAVSLRYLVDQAGADGWLGIAIALGMEEHGIPSVGAEELRTVDVPLRFVHGRDDDIAPLYRVRALTALTDGASLHVVDGGDHFLQQHLDAVTDEVVTFAASVGAP